MSHSNTLRLVIAVIFAFNAPALSAQTIDEIVVSADFRSRHANELATSVTLIDAETLQQNAVQHFEELISTVPNLNWSGDGNRARYLQIRGVGELEQYQGAPNPSIGFLIDDIDFSGLGSIATLFDLQQIEVLRGPQGTRYGANALAGLIYLRSAEPTVDWAGRAQISLGGDGARSLGFAFGGPLADGERLLFRVSAHHHESDGFRDNPFLNRNDTNGRDETTIRGRLLWQPNSDWSINVAAMAVDVDDGYDAFAIDNSLTVLSDNPGRDAQNSVGASIKVEWSALDSLTVTSITAVADSDINFDFDADWGNEQAWAPITYDFISQNDRVRRTISQEFRLHRDNWLIGIYALNLQDEIVTFNRGEYFDPNSGFADNLNDTLSSDYEANSVALFGQYDHDIGTATRLAIGLRIERRTTNYVDSTALSAGPSETMVGGELSLSHQHAGGLTSFISLSNGYKAGGFNLGVVPDNRRKFAAESLWNIEAGVKSILWNDSLRINTSLFYSRRDDQQVRTSFQLDPGDPTTFVFFTDNAAKGKTLGLESEVQWQPNHRWMLYANVGLLDATFDEFSTPQVELGGRRQAHAPAYSAAAGLRYRYSKGFFARLDVSAKDEFFFDVGHDQKSNSYELVHARVGFERATWNVQLWARNLLDKEYAVRGFFFGNEPPNFPATLYTRLGDGRQLGVTIDKSF